MPPSSQLGKRCSQTKSNLGHAALLRRCELPLCINESAELTFVDIPTVQRAAFGWRPPVLLHHEAGPGLRFRGRGENCQPAGHQGQDQGGAAKGSHGAGRLSGEDHGAALLHS